MKRIKQYAFFFSFGFFVYKSEIKAQAINGDTILVDSKIVVAVRFPSLPTNFYTNPPDAPYNLVSLPTGFTIIAKKKNTAPAELFVIENKRAHKFIVVNQKPPDGYSRITDYDFSTVKKLKERIQQMHDHEKKYIEAITAADRLYNEEKYEEAKKLYNTALDLNKNPWPKEQIAKINKKLKKQKHKKN